MRLGAPRRARGTPPFFLIFMSFPALPPLAALSSGAIHERIQSAGTTEEFAAAQP